MLSRVANSVYWLNRYVERAEDVARFVDVNLHLSLDLPEHTEGLWMPLVTTSGDDTLFAKHYGDPTKVNVMRFLTADTGNPNSILSCLTKARENARSVREVISSEMWEQVNRTYLRVREELDAGTALQRPHAFFTQVKEASHLFGGLMDATMQHGEAWHFGHLGRLLERADKTSRMVDVKYYILLPSPRDVGSPLDDLQWGAVLKSASALEMYRKQRRRRISPVEVADFLLFDREFPRSVRYCVTGAEVSLHAITGTPPGTFANEAEKRLGQLRADLSFRDIPEVMRAGLHEFLDDVQRSLNGVGDAIHDTFFALRPLAGVVAGPGDGGQRQQ